MNFNRCLRQQIAGGNEFHLERVEKRIAHLTRQLQHFPISPTKIIVVDLVGGNVKIPMPLVAVLDLEGGGYCHELFQAANEIGACVGFFGHQCPLIHSSTPFLGFATASDPGNRRDIRRCNDFTRNARHHAKFAWIDQCLKHR